MVLQSVSKEKQQITKAILLKAKIVASLFKLGCCVIVFHAMEGFLTSRIQKINLKKKMINYEISL